jgi:hypothetical protein
MARELEIRIKANGSRINREMKKGRIEDGEWSMKDQG